MTKLVHDVGGLVVVDHSAAAPYRLIDIDEIDADVVAVNAVAWGGPPIGALVFRDPSVIDTFSSVSLNPNATGPARLEIGRAPVRPARRRRRQHRVPGVTGRVGARHPPRKTVGVDAIGGVVHGPALRLPAGLVAVACRGDGDRPPEAHIPVLSFAVSDVPAERVVQRLADNGILRDLQRQFAGARRASASTTSAAR